MLIEFPAHGSRTRPQLAHAFAGSRGPLLQRAVHHYPEFCLAVSPTCSASNEMAQINHPEADGQRRREREREKKCSLRQSGNRKSLHFTTKQASTAQLRNSSIQCFSLASEESHTSPSSLRPDYLIILNAARWTYSDFMTQSFFLF